MMCLPDGHGENIFIRKRISRCNINSTLEAEGSEAHMECCRKNGGYV